MRCSKSCYLYDLELVDLFDNEVIEQVYCRVSNKSLKGTSKNLIEFLAMPKTSCKNFMGEHYDRRYRF